MQAGKARLLILKEYSQPAEPQEPVSQCMRYVTGLIWAKERGLFEVKQLVCAVVCCCDKSNRYHLTGVGPMAHTTTITTLKTYPKNNKHKTGERSLHL